jgi:hypothetical protein
MSVYKNTAGPFTIEVSEPSPMWVKIKCNTWRETEIEAVTTAALYDLRHLVDRAIAAAEAKERKQ